MNKLSRWTDEEGYISKETLPLISMEIGMGSTVNKYSWGRLRVMMRDTGPFGPKLGKCNTLGGERKGRNLPASIRAGSLHGALAPAELFNYLDSYIVGKYQCWKDALEIKMIT
jgi:hypothetical protein